MELLLTPEEIEHQIKDTAIGERKVAITTKRMDVWQKSQKIELQDQYDQAVRKIQIALLKKKNQVELSKYRLKARESLADFDVYQAKILEIKTSKIDAKLDQAKFNHDLEVKKLHHSQDEKVTLLNQASTKLINNLKENKDLTTVLATINAKHDLKIKEVELQKESRLTLIKNHYDQNFARLDGNRLRSLKVNQEKLHRLEVDNVAEINQDYVLEIEQIEAQTAKRFKNADASYEKLVRFYARGNEWKLKKIANRKQKNLASIQNYHDIQIMKAQQRRDDAIKVNQEKLVQFRETYAQLVESINTKFIKESQILEEQTTKRIAKANLDYQKDLEFYHAKQEVLLTSAKQRDYQGFDQKKVAIETKFKTRTEKIQNRTLKKIASLDKKLDQAWEKHDKKLAILEGTHIVKAQKGHDRFLVKPPLTDNELRKLQLTNNAIINDLKEYQVSQIGKYEHQIDLLTQNLNQGMIDIDDGVKSNVDQASKTNISKVNRKYDKKNFKANYQKEANKLIEEDRWNHHSAHQLLVDLYNRSDKNYTPVSILTTDLYQGQKTKFQNWWLSIRIKYARCREWSFKEWISLKIWGMPVYVYAVLFGIMAAVLATGYAEVNMMYPAFLLFTIAIIGGTIFSKVPIWNKYLGGAVMGCLFIGAFLVYFNAIPKDGDVYKSIKTWFNSQGFLDFYISVILICAVIVVPRRILLKALGGFIIILAIGSLAGAGTGILGGLMVGFSSKKTIINYILPILGGGNGAGAVPMSQVIGNNWGQAVGDAWYSKAIAITVIANIFSILFAAILSGVGRAKPEMSGGGNLSRSNIHIIEDKVQLKDRNTAAALVMVLGIYVLSTIISSQILTKDRIHITLPNYAWMIIICLALNFTNVIPRDMKAGMEKIQTFISKQTTWLVMLAIGITSIDLKAFVNALTGETFLITLLTCLGATLIPMLLAKLFMFYPVEAGITAGCCMTAQGGAGVIGVLGASNRMKLMPYGQISTRIGGSVVLIIASVLFSSWNPQVFA